MADLIDYSGEFRPDLKYESFSKDTLARLLYEFARVTNVLDGEYTTEIMIRYGQEEALNSQHKVWERHGPRVMRWIRKTLNIQGDDVATYFRLLQMLPSFSPEHYDIEWALLSPEHGIFTVTRCKFLEEMEKAGQGFEKLIYGGVRAKVLPHAGQGNKSPYCVEAAEASSQGKQRRDSLPVRVQDRAHRLVSTSVTEIIVSTS